MTVPEPSDPAESEIPEWLAIGRTGSCNGHAVLRAVQTFGSVGALFDAGERDLAVLGFSPAAVERIRRVDWSAVRRDL